MSRQRGYLSQSSSCPFPKTTALQPGRGARRDEFRQLPACWAKTGQRTPPAMITRFSHLRGAQPPTARVDASPQRKRVRDQSACCAQIFVTARNDDPIRGILSSPPFSPLNRRAVNSVRQRYCRPRSRLRLVGDVINEPATASAARRACDQCVPALSALSRASINSRVPLCNSSGLCASMAFLLTRAKA